MSIEVLIIPALIDLAVMSHVLMENHKRATMQVRLEKGLLTKEEEEDMRLEVESLKRAGCDIRTGTDTKGSDMLIHTDKGYDIGLKRNDKGAYDIVTHWSSQPGKAQIQQAGAEIKDTIKQKYAYEKVKRELAKKGFVIASEEVQADNTIKVVARKW